MPRLRAGTLCIERLLISIAPDSANSSPATTRNNVVLPEPDGSAAGVAQGCLTASATERQNAWPRPRCYSDTLIGGKPAEGYPSSNAWSVVTSHVG
jgi:hypothetical protein